LFAETSEARDKTVSELTSFDWVALGAELVMKGLCNVSEPHRGVDKEKAAITSLLDFDGLNMGQSHFANIDKSDLVARLSRQLSHHEHFHDFS